MSNIVSVFPCENYEKNGASEALSALLAPLGGLDWVEEGMKIAIKTNLVTFLRPETAAVTHPALITELCRLLTQRGAEVTVGDSPGGPYNAAMVGRAYSVAGLRAVEEAGARLNDDFSVAGVKFPEARALREFQYTAWLQKADAVINFCKLKTHGLTSLSCGVKNLFGVIPGTRKPELHYAFPRVRDFSEMLVDLNEYVRPRLTIVDAVEGMEGNGPTQGTPRKIGALLASSSPYAVDVLAAELIGLAPMDVPTIAAAAGRGLGPASVDELEILGEWRGLVIRDYKLQPKRESASFESRRFLGPLISSIFSASPAVSREQCVGCGECERVCPQKTIKVSRGFAVISRKNCISCYCCGEFCPKGAITMRRSALARLMSK